MTHPEPNSLVEPRGDHRETLKRGQVHTSRTEENLTLRDVRANTRLVEIAHTVNLRMENHGVVRLERLLCTMFSDRETQIKKNSLFFSKMTSQALSSTQARRSFFREAAPSGVSASIGGGESASSPAFCVPCARSSRGKPRTANTCALVTVSRYHVGARNTYTFSFHPILVLNLFRDTGRDRFSSLQRRLSTMLQSRQAIVNGRWSN